MKITGPEAKAILTHASGLLASLDAASVLLPELVAAGVELLKQKAELTKAEILVAKARENNMNLDSALLAREYDWRSKGGRGQHHGHQQKKPAHNEGQVAAPFNGIRAAINGKKDEAPQPAAE